VHVWLIKITRKKWILEAEGCWLMDHHKTTNAIYKKSLMNILLTSEQKQITIPQISSKNYSNRKKANQLLVN
jgi:hypothetical protein